MSFSVKQLSQTMKIKYATVTIDAPGPAHTYNEERHAAQLMNAPEGWIGDQIKDSCTLGHWEGCMR